MNQNLKIGVLIGVVASVALMIGVVIGSFSNGGLTLGGVTFDKELFRQGITIGDQNQLTIDKSGNATSSGTMTITGDIRLKSPILTGASSTLTAAATTTITAAQACDNGIVNFNPQALTVGSTTLPSAATVYADCLTTTGDEVTFLFRNLSSATTTQFVAGASTTMVYLEATGIDSTVNTSGWAWVRLMRMSNTEMYASIEEMVDAD